MNVEMRISGTKQSSFLIFDLKELNAIAIVNLSLYSHVRNARKIRIGQDNRYL